MAVNPGYDGNPLEEPTEQELAAALTQMNVLGEGGQPVKISQFAMFYPGVSRRKVLMLLEGLTAQGHLNQRLNKRWYEWTVKE